jgi:hypothetical protein
VAHILAQHLVAEVGACVDGDALAIYLDHCRGAETPIALIC